MTYRTCFVVSSVLSAESLSMHQDLVNSNKEHLLTSMLFGRSPSKIVSTLLAVVEVVVVVVMELAVPDMDAMIIIQMIQHQNRSYKVLRQPNVPKFERCSKVRDYTNKWSHRLHRIHVFFLLQHNHTRFSPSRAAL